MSTRTYSLLRITLFTLLIIGLVSSVFQPQSTVSAAAVLTISPITWNVIGLDSNNVSVGPNNFPVGARVCNTSTGGETLTNIIADLVWHDGLASHPYINLRSSSQDPITATSLAPGACTDFYFEVTITRNAAAYNQRRNYHINVTSTQTGVTVFSTPTPREPFVEHLVSQSRNTISDVQYGTSLASLSSVANGGTMALTVGNTYYIKLMGATATNGYEQIESFINFPNTVFQILSVATTYTADTSPYLSSPNDRLYGDACLWENDPNSPNYRACLGVGKAGGGTTVTYQVRILNVGSTNPEPLSTLIYDFSGSSYHYNADFGVSTRYAYIIDPASAVNVSKTFNPSPTNAGGISSLIFTLTNSAPVAISGLNFSDTLPTTPSAMTVANPATASSSGCGSPTITATAGAASITVTNATVPASGSCTLSVNVTAAATGTYNNLSNHLFVNTLDTGKTASASLTVNSAPPAGAGICGLPLAQWTFPTGFSISSPTPTTSTVTASASPGAGITSVDSTQNNSGATHSWGSNGAIDTSVTLNTANNDYFEFAVDTTGSTSVTLSFSARRTNNGPLSLAVYYG